MAHVAGGNGPGSDGYFTVNNPAGPNGGGSYTNIYTLIMDIQIGEHGTYSSMYQTNTSNSNDGDWFIRDLGDGGGLGISGVYEDAGNPLRFTYGEWQRIALVVDTSNNALRSYVDGELQNIVEGETFSQDGRWTLEDVFHIFVDNGDETAGDLWVNSFQLRDYAMSDGELAALGGATAYGIPEPATISLLALGLSALRRR